MLRIILGVIVGFVVWTIIWLGGGVLNKMIEPNNVPNPDLSNITTYYLLIKIMLSIFSSIVAGFLAVLVSKEFKLTTWILGSILLLIGILVESSIWNYVPLWYHISFLILLIPMTIFGGKLRKI